MQFYIASTDFIILNDSLGCDYLMIFKKPALTIGFVFWTGKTSDIMLNILFRVIISRAFKI